MYKSFAVNVKNSLLLSVFIFTHAASLVCVLFVEMEALSEKGERVDYLITSMTALQKSGMAVSYELKYCNPECRCTSYHFIQTTNSQ